MERWPACAFLTCPGTIPASFAEYECEVDLMSEHDEKRYVLRSESENTGLAYDFFDGIAKLVEQARQLHALMQLPSGYESFLVGTREQTRKMLANL